MLEEQRTLEWHEQRLGKATASSIYKIMARTKTGYGADRANYQAQLVAERLSGRPTDNFTNSAMQWGVEKEAEARLAYAEYIGDLVPEIGFLDHPVIEWSGASPDGLVGFDGLLEIKCPNTATHIATLKGAGIDRKYLLQMQWQMDCSGRDWCDFLSFDPRMPDEMRLHVRRVERDETLLAEVREEVARFLEEVAADVEQLTNTYRKAA